MKVTNKYSGEGEYVEPRILSCFESKVLVPQPTHDKVGENLGSLLMHARGLT